MWYIAYTLHSGAVWLLISVVSSSIYITIIEVVTIEVVATCNSVFGMGVANGS